MANNQKILNAMEPVRAELKAAQKECEITCTGPATRQALQSVRQLSRVALGASVATAGIRYGMKKFAASRAAKTAGAVVEPVSARFKVLTSGAIAASLAATYVSGQVNSYVDKHDEASREQIASIRAQLATLQATLNDSNKNVASIVAQNERISAALQADLTVMKEIQK